MIVSPEPKLIEFNVMNVMGEIGLITRAIAPVVEPVISSPFVNEPLAPVTVNCGSVGFALASSESNTP